MEGSVADQTQGLVLRHINARDHEPEPAGVDMWEGGTLFRIRRKESLLRPKRKGGGRRGVIQQFSNASRLRLMRMLSKLRSAEPPLFVTLTYPDWACPTPDEYKLHRKRLKERIRRRFPHSAGMWKLEFTRQGVPHIHLLVWLNEPSLTLEQQVFVFRRWMAEAWYEVVGTGEEAHRVAGTQVDRARSSKAVSHYIGKYVWKKGYQTESPEVWGRFWAVFGSEFLPWAEKYSVPIPDWAAVRMLRYARRFAKIRSRSYPSLSVFTVDPEEWMRLTAYTISTGPP